MRQLIAGLMVLLLATGQGLAARIDTLMVYSKKMDKDVKVVVVVPKKVLSHQELRKDKKCPTLYLLHGYSGDCFDWLGIRKDLPQMADQMGFMIVCPSAENSWYWDSPKNKDSQFETFVAKELVDYIDEHYPAIANRGSRAISGLSMGGHGALWLAIRHKEIFGACGSTSGGVDIRPFPNNWEMKKQLGEKEGNEAVWDSHTVMTQLDKIKDGELKIIFDCGTEDFFYEVNVKLHKELMKRGIHHDFISRPGTHNVKYWRNSIEYQWLFFRKGFI